MKKAITIFIIICLLCTSVVNAAELETESTIEVLKRIELLLTGIQFTGIFALMVYFSEKWLKALLEYIKRETGG